MKEKTKEFLKKNLIGFILGFVSVGIVAVYAETYFPSDDVTYDNSESGLSSTDVQGAIDELYTECTKEPTAGETIIEDAGLEKDPYECRYFFTGANPNNYITFNDEVAKWRIISIECDGRIKIMRIASVKDHFRNIQGDPETWATDGLSVYLNETYYENKLNDIAKKQIVLSDFSIGEVVVDNNDLATQISNENSMKWNGNIALPTVSEYIRTNSDKSNCGTFSLNNDNYKSCVNTGWMDTNAVSWWSLSLSHISNVYFFVDLEGNISYSNYIYGDSRGTRPTLYLSPDIKITSGTGAKSDPYTLSL